MALTAITTRGQSEPGSNGNEWGISPFLEYIDY